MRIALFIVAFAVFALPAHAARSYREVTVAEPYIELHTGPGRGYPVTQVVERGGRVVLLKRRTSWFKVRTRRGLEGWVSEAALAQTLNDRGEAVVIGEQGFDDYANRRWEMGVLGGDFGGADLLSVYGAFNFSPNLSVELWAGQALGAFSDSVMGSVDIVHQFAPEWRASPFFSLGTGVINTSPKATLVQTEDRQDQFARAGLGVRTWLTRQFVLRLEYKRYVVLTSRNDNEDVSEWKAGFSFFF